MLALNGGGPCALPRPIGPELGRVVGGRGWGLPGVRGRLSMADLDLRHVHIHGHDVGYRMGGSGPALPVDPRHRRQLDGVEGGHAPTGWEYTVIAPDLLGHGESRQADGRLLLGAVASGLRPPRVLGVTRATIVGQSFGGGVAMQLAYQHPELCERLVLVNSGGLGREVSWMLRLLTLPGAEFVMPVLFLQFLRPWGDATGRWLGAQGVRSARIRDVAAYGSLYGLREPPGLRPHDAGRHRSRRPDGQRPGPSLPGVPPPHPHRGDRDTIIPVEHAYQAHEAIPGSRPRSSRARPLPHVERPDEFSEVLLDFSTSPNPPRSTWPRFRSPAVPSPRADRRNDGRAPLGRRRGAGEAAGHSWSRFTIVSGGSSPLQAEVSPPPASSSACASTGCGSGNPEGGSAAGHVALEQDALAGPAPGVGPGGDGGQEAWV